MPMQTLFQKAVA